MLVLAGTSDRMVGSPIHLWAIRIASHNVIVAEESEKSPAIEAPDAIA